MLNDELEQGTEDDDFVADEEDLKPEGLAQFSYEELEHQLDEASSNGLNTCAFNVLSISNMTNNGQIS